MLKNGTEYEHALSEGADPEGTVYGNLCVNQYHILYTMQNDY